MPRSLSHRRVRRRAFFGLGLCVALGAGAAIPPLRVMAQTTREATAAEIRQSIAELSDVRYTVRDTATRRLWQAGKGAEPALEEAAKSDDPEVASRARQILADFHSGISPDTPHAALPFMRRYRDGDRESKRAVIEDLTDEWDEMRGTISRLAKLESKTALRNELFGNAANRARRTALELIVKGDLSAAREMADLGAADGSPEGMRGQVSFVLVQGKARELIDELRGARVKRADANRLLWRLQRAVGDRAEALKAAEAADDPTAVEGILLERRDFAGLIRFWQAPLVLRGERNSGLLAAYQRLSGDVKGAERTLDELRPNAAGGRNEAMQALPALFLNDHPDEAMDLLRSFEQWPRLFELLSAREQYEAALDLAAKRPVGPLLVGNARLLHLLGKNDVSQKAFEETAQRFRDGTASPDWPELVGAERECGLTELGRSQVLQLMALDYAGEALSQLLDAPGSRPVWRLCRATYPKETFEQTLGRVEKLVQPRLDEEGKNLRQEMVQKGLRHDRTLGEPALQAIAQSLADAGEDTQAREIFALAGKRYFSAGCWRSAGLADLRMKDFAAAEKDFAKALEFEQRDAAAMYLRGHALRQLGKEKEAADLQLRASLLPMGSADARIALLGALIEAGLEEDVRAQERVLEGTCEPMSSDHSNVMRVLAMGAERRGDMIATARLRELSMLQALNPGVTYVQDSYYLTVPHQVHKAKAIALAVEGKWEECDAEVERCFTFLPSDIQIGVDLAPVMDGKGEKKRADALVERCLAAQQKLVEKYPQSPSIHNSIAWLLCRSGRKLDEALKHAKEAAMLEPFSTAILDTLAETQFQRGDRAGALATMKKCVQLEPRVKRHRQQMERFEKLTPASAPPPG